MQNETIRPRVNWIWLLVLYSFASFVETVFFGQLTAFTPLYLPKLGIQASDVALWTGWVASIAALIGIPFVPLWGALADRFSRKPVIIRSFAIELASGLLAVIAGNIWVFVIGRTLAALAMGNSGLMLATLSEHVPSNRQGLAFSIMSTASPIGSFLGPLIGGPIVDRWGFQAMMGIDILLLLVVVLALAFGYREYFKGTERGPVLRMAFDSVCIISCIRRLQALFPALFMLFAGWMMANTYVSLAVSRIYGGADLGSIVGVIVGVSGLAALVLSPLIGGLADRFGYWKLLFIGVGLEVLLWPLPALAQSPLAFGAAYALINGLATGVFSISFNVVVQSTREDVRGRVMSFAYLPVNIGLVLGPIVGSLVSGGGVQWVFPAAAGLTLLGFGLLALAYRQKV